MELQPALGAAALTDLIIATLYAWAGLAIATRPFAPDARAAGRLFALWWFGVAATGIASVAVALLAAKGADPRLVDLVDQLNLVAFASGLVGFTCYLCFLFFGTHKGAPWIALAYAALVAWSAGSALTHPATGYHFEAWRPIVERAPGAGGPSPTLMSLLLSVPLVGGIGAYASLLRRRTLDAETRRRVLMVTVSLVAWLVGATIVSIAQVGAGAVAQAAGRAIVIVSGLFILAAYRPQAPRAAGEPSPTDRRAALHERVMQLV